MVKSDFKELDYILPHQRISFSFYSCYQSHISLLVPIIMLIQLQISLFISQAFHAIPLYSNCSHVPSALHGEVLLFQNVVQLILTLFCTTFTDDFIIFLNRSLLHIFIFSAALSLYFFTAKFYICFMEMLCHHIGLLHACTFSFYSVSFYLVTAF